MQATETLIGNSVIYGKLFALNGSYKKLKISFVQSYADTNLFLFFRSGICALSIRGGTGDFLGVKEAIIVGNENPPYTLEISEDNLNIYLHLLSTWEQLKLLATCNTSIRIVMEDDEYT